MKEGRTLPVPENHFGKADTHDSSSWEIQADSASGLGSWVDGRHSRKWGCRGQSRSGGRSGFGVQGRAPGSWSGGVHLSWLSGAVGSRQEAWGSGLTPLHREAWEHDRCWELTPPILQTPSGDPQPQRPLTSVSAAWGVLVQSEARTESAARGFCPLISAGHRVPNSTAQAASSSDTCFSVLEARRQNQGVGRAGVWGGRSSWLADGRLFAVPFPGKERALVSLIRTPPYRTRVQPHDPVSPSLSPWGSGPQCAALWGGGYIRGRRARRRRRRLQTERQEGRSQSERGCWKSRGASALPPENPNPGSQEDATHPPLPSTRCACQVRVYC